MKKTLLIASFVALSFSVSAQDTITNRGFERWTPSGKPAPFDWQEPEAWTSSNGLTEFIGAAVTKTQYPNTISNQVKIKTLNVFGNAVPGLLINGDFTLNVSDTGTLPLLGGVPWSAGNKTILYGLYNFTATDTTDSAMAIVMFKHYDNSNNVPVADAGGSTLLPPTGPGMFPFAVDISQITFNTPDSMVITLVSSKEDNFKMGGELTVDFVSFDQPLAVKPIANTNITVYPNPATNLVSVWGVESGLPYSVLDITGKQLISGTTTSYTSIDVDHLDNGCYIININGATTRFIKE